MSRRLLHLLQRRSPRKSGSFVQPYFENRRFASWATQDSELMTDATPSSSQNHPMVLKEAIRSLQDFGSSLRDIAERVDRKHSIPGTTSNNQNKSSRNQSNTAISVAEIALHSRDANPSAFGSSIAKNARSTLSPVAVQLEQDLRKLSETYRTRVQPKMEEATLICQQTPCGGASWELDLESLVKKTTGEQQEVSPDGNQRVKLGGLEDTPCGRLQLASMEFLEITRQTKPQIAMAARACAMLSLAQEFNKPLDSIRKHGTASEKERLHAQFQPSKTVSTPWVRSDQEYQSLLEIQETMKK